MIQIQMPIDYSFNYNQQILMEGQAPNLFLKVAKKVRKLQYFQKILEFQENRFDYRPYSIETLMPDKAVEIYGRIQAKYKEVNDVKINPEFWYESQKRLYVWFMVLYTYFYKPQAADLETIDYQLISNLFFNKNMLFLEFHFLNLLKTCEKVTWTEEQDQLLLSTIETEGMKWSEISKHIFTVTNRQLFRSPKHCRERWMNHLDYSKVHGNWSDQEDYLIFQFVLQREGKRWSKMVSLLNSKRTQHMIKNRYNSLVTKRKIHKQERQNETAKKILIELRERLGKQKIYFGFCKSGKNQNNSAIESSQRESKIQKSQQDSEYKRNMMQAEKVLENDQEFKIFTNLPIQVSHNSSLVQQRQEVEYNYEEKMKRMKEEQNNLNFQALSYQLSNNYQDNSINKKVGQSLKEEIVNEEIFAYENENLEKFNIEERKDQLPLGQEQDMAECQNQIYPFNNYSYELQVYNYNTQMYEFHKNQLMFYQQFLTFQPLPTADTSIASTQIKTKDITFTFPPKKQ